GFFISGILKSPMKTICYVDGYNLYYGCLKNTAFKWLDLHALLTRILHVQNPTTEIVAIKFFTAPVITKFATHGDLAQASQQQYHRALIALYPDTMQIINGYYTTGKHNAMVYQAPPNKEQRVDVWRLEEKQTDVNLALQAYRDAAMGLVQQLVFVTNDTDQEPTLKQIQEDFADRIKIGVVLPISEPRDESAARPGNRRLSVFADWTRKHIKMDELLQAQLPSVIPTGKKPIRKPVYW
ncbi:MAG TPA: NYN domain-containing protein, partial [Cellvibrionaceae bacterium]|nr:NYN domain-containing protein [Cellvibrionaceae bacterium]